MNNKIQQAIKLGKLSNLHDIIDKLPKKQQKQIEERARYIKIAISVRQLRKQLKLTQQELAKKLHKKREFISKVESGKQNITLKTLYQIAEATNKEIVFQFK